MYYYGARYYDPKISLFVSADPLMTEFPNFTPYNYTMNNPLNMTDPTGMAPEGIIIRGKNGTSYTYNEENKYTGKDKFIKSALNAIDKLKASETGFHMIEELDHSDNNFYIESGSDNNFNPTLESFADPTKATESTKKINAQGKIGSGGVINWNEQEMRLPTTTSDLTSAYLVLGHELGHALDSNRGKLDRTLESGVKKSEWQAVYRENLIRSELKLPLRTHYGRTLEKGTNKYLGPAGPTMLNKNNSIIKPSWYD